MSGIGSKLKSFFKSFTKPSSGPILQAAKKVVKPNSRTPQIKFRYGGSKRGDVLTGVRAANQGGKDELISQVKQQVKPKAPKTPVGAGFHARDGSGSMNELLHNTPIVAAKAKAPPLPSKPLPVTKLPTIEDWQLQPRFRRKPLKPIEIEYINRGGPDI